MFEQKLRSFLLIILGADSYLRLVSFIYLHLIKAGFLKKKYPELFYLETLIKPGFICIDIGSNVGYYSVSLSKFAGDTGHVYSIEPVPLFVNVFLKNIKKFGRNNITLYQCALGGEKKDVILGTPIIKGVFRHGLTKVLDQPEAEGTQNYKAKMEVPDELFNPLSKIDYIKCDVEGYEVHLFPQMLNTLHRFKPLIQIEILDSSNRNFIINLLKPIGYKPFGLINGNLEQLSDAQAFTYEKGDFYFKVAE